MTVDFDLELLEGAPLAAVLLHPHPGMGGDRFNHVIATLFRALPAAGFSALRFDFSSAEPDRARAEAEEAVDLVRSRTAAPGRAGGGAVALVGYSFGADVALTVTGAPVTGWVLVAPPLSRPAPPAGPDPRPKALLVAEHDQFSPPARVAEASAGWVATGTTVVRGADHFLVGEAETVAALVVSRLAGWAPVGAGGTP